MIYGYKRKWEKRTYFGPLAESKRLLAATASAENFAMPVKGRKLAPESRRELSAELAKCDRKLKILNRAKTIRRKSPKQAKSDRLYMADAKAFLALAENKFCRVAWLRDGEKVLATENHHVRGRHRSLKFDRRFFCPTSFSNGRWIHNNISAARALGLLAQPGEWHNAPSDDETRRIENWMREKGIF